MSNKVIAAKWNSEVINCDESNIIDTLSDKLNTVKEPLFVLAYFSDSVKVGFYKDKRIHFYEEAEIDTKKLEEIRIFNEKMELRLVRNEIIGDMRTFIGRSIYEKNISYFDEDFIEQDNFIYDERFLVYGRGNKSSNINNWTMVREDRGGELWLPLEGIKWLGVRNYLEYKDELKFVGNRLLGFYGEGGKYLGGELNGLDGR